MAAKVLGQSAPAATTDTDIYTVPAGKSAVCSTLVICNRDTVAVTYRVAVRVGGAALANSQYIAYGISLPSGASDYLTAGITLAAGDVVTVYASTANMTFSLFGDES